MPMLIILKWNVEIKESVCEVSRTYYTVLGLLGIDDPNLD